MSIHYGEVKTKKRIFPSEAQAIVNKGSVKILITQAIASDTTKAILTENGITLYEGVEPEKVTELLKEVTRQLEINKEQKESE